jgi:hypothetical protein
MISDSRTAAPQPPTYVGYSIACTEEYRALDAQVVGEDQDQGVGHFPRGAREWALTRGHAAPPPR